MSKPVKVEDGVYNQLDQLRRKGETFSQVVESLLDARKKTLEAIYILEGALKYHEWREEKLRQYEAANRRADSP